MDQPVAQQYKPLKFYDWGQMKRDLEPHFAGMVDRPYWSPERDGTRVPRREVQSYILKELEGLLDNKPRTKAVVESRLMTSRDIHDVVQPVFGGFFSDPNTHLYDKEKDVSMLTQRIESLNSILQLGEYPICLCEGDITLGDKDKNKKEFAIMPKMFVTNFGQVINILVGYGITSNSEMGAIYRPSYLEMAHEALPTADLDRIIAVNDSLRSVEGHSARLILHLFVLNFQRTKALRYVGNLEDEVDTDLGSDYPDNTSDLDFDLEGKGDPHTEKCSVAKPFHGSAYDPLGWSVCLRGSRGRGRGRGCRGRGFGRGNVRGRGSNRGNGRGRGRGAYMAPETLQEPFTPPYDPSPTSS